MRLFYTDYTTLMTMVEVTAINEAARLFREYGYERAVALARLFGKKETDRGFWLRVRLHLRNNYRVEDTTRDMYALRDIRSRIDARRQPS